MQTETFNEHVLDYETWYERYNLVYLSEIRAIKEHFKRLPEAITGIEVGLGTGRFAVPLGIKEGVEPALEMAKIATRRGIEVMEGWAEALPYKDLHFDFVLMVTVCHFRDIAQTIKEAHRVLKNGGCLIVGLINEHRDIAKAYIAKKKRSVFYKKAQFYTPEYITKLMKDHHFFDFQYNQTLFGTLDAIDEIQMPKPGYGEGGFVVISAFKK